MDRIAVLVTGYGHEKLPNVFDGTGGEALHALISFGTPRARMNERDITRHVSMENKYWVT